MRLHDVTMQIIHISLIHILWALLNLTLLLIEKNRKIAIENTGNLRSLEAIFNLGTLNIEYACSVCVVKGDNFFVCRRTQILKKVCFQKGNHPINGKEFCFSLTPYFVCETGPSNSVISLHFRVLIILETNFLFESYVFWHAYSRLAQKTGKRK